MGSSPLPPPQPKRLSFNVSAEAFAQVAASVCFRSVAVGPQGQGDEMFLGPLPVTVLRVDPSREGGASEDCGRNFAKVRLRAFERQTGKVMRQPMARRLGR